MQMFVTMLLVTIALVYIVRRYWPAAYRIRWLRAGVGTAVDLRRTFAVSHDAPSVAPGGACGSGCNVCSGCGRFSSGSRV